MLNLAMKTQACLLLGFVVAFGSSFAPLSLRNPVLCHAPLAPQSTQLNERLSRKRRDQLGVGDDEEEYDLGVALSQNTDDFINKVVAGSLIVTILCLLVAGVIIPATTDYGDGVCNPLLTGGRC